MTEYLFVATLELKTGQSWTSLHQSYDTALQALIDKANDWHVNVLGIPVESLADLDTPAVRCYGISRLPVQP